MTEAQVIAMIQQYIVENHNEEITANVLRPILEAMVSQPNDLIGDLDSLTTTYKNDLVGAINEVHTLSQNGLTIHYGTDLPNDTPPAGQDLGDFYAQIDNTDIVSFWQYNGNEWVEIKEDTGIDPSEFTKFKNSIGNISFPFPVKYLFEIALPLRFKEAGNVIFDEDLQKYICITSVYTTGIPNVTAAYLFTSTDGYTWVNEGELSSLGNSEDHYLAKHNGTYFVYAEKKSITPPLVLGVQLHTSTDLTTWTDNGVVLPKGSTGDWDSTDTSSPTVLIKNGTFYMLFEGRGDDATGIAEDGSVGVANKGSIGLATSSDGINWVKSPLNPIIKGAQYQDADCAWGVNIVPDDLIQLGDEWFLSCHAYTGKGWVNAIFYSTDLDQGWHDYLRTWQRTGAGKDFNTDGLMFLKTKTKLEMYACTSDGMILAEFNNSRGDEWLVSNTSGYLAYPIRAMSRNEVINFTGNANRNILLGADKNTSLGVQKIIKNKTTDFNLTLDLGADMTIDGSSNSYVLRPQEVLRIYNTSRTNWEILSKSKIDTFDTIDSKVDDEPTGSDKVVNVVSLTQAEYDGGTPKANTFYVITDA